MNLETQNLCARLTLAALNGLYQGILVCVGVAMLLRLLRWTNAATRHAVWFATLILVFALIPAHYFLDPSVSSVAGPSLSSAASPTGPVAAASPAALLDLQERSSEPESQDDSNWDVADKDQEAPETALEPRRLVAEQREPKISLPVPPSVSEGGFPLPLKAPEWGVGSERMSVVVIIALLLWCIIAGWRLCVLVWGVARLNSLARGSAPVDGGLQQMLEELRLAGGVSRTVSLRCSGSNRSPVVLGFFRPMILLPTGMANDSEETRQVLSHELAHVRRCDDWANLFQHLVQALLFFHPAVWWIGKRLSLEREIACDDHVLGQGIGSRRYALALAAVASRIQEQTPLLAPGISVSHSQLQQRIDMILNKRRNSSTSLAKGRLTALLVFGVMMSVAALYAAPRVVITASPSITSSVDVDVSSDSSPAIVAATDVRVQSSPEPSVSVSVGEPGPTPSPQAVEAGPKAKPEAPSGEPTEPPEVANVPQPPASPDMPSPRMKRAPKAKRAPRAFDTMEADGGGDGSLEQRLDRLEKMVRSLVEQNGVKHSHGMALFKDGDNQNENLDERQIEKMKQLAERQAARAAEQAERVTEMTKRATRDMEARLQDEGMKGERGEGLQRELEALRKAREGLGQEMERLEREIKKLEKQQRGDADQQRRGEQSSDKLHWENVPAPESNGF